MDRQKEEGQADVQPQQEVSMGARQPARKQKFWYSIQFRFFIAIGAIALVFIGILSILNVFFYDTYYRAERKKVLLNVYQQVKTQYTGEVDDAFLIVMYQCENTNSVRLSVEQDGLLYSVGQGMHVKQDERKEIATSVLNMLDSKDLEDLSKNGYTYVMTAVGGYEDETYLCLVGALGDEQNAYLFAAFPYSAIKQTSSFNTIFLLITSLITLLICMVLAYIISRQFTRPLIRMEEVATSMADLDFSKKYEGQAKDEIGQLGQSINQLSEHLEQAIGELQQSNVQLGQEIREKERIDSMRREFIVNVSHELKTPIAVIQGYAEGLREGVTTDEEDRRYYCDTIVDESRRMNQLVMQLLSLSKLELGRETPEPSEVGLREICMPLVEKTAVLRSEKSQTIDMTGVQGTMYVDERMLEQVVSNYLSNAIRYTPENGAIRMWSEQGAEQTTISVMNEGDPIAEDEREMIFEKFYRTDKARTRDTGGTGIGLSIVRAIADAHHGACGVENVEGGVRFWFTVPNAPREKTPEDGAGTE